MVAIPWVVFHTLFYPILVKRSRIIILLTLSIIRA